MEQHLGYLLPVATLCVVGAIWHRRGRDPRGRGTVVAEYRGPEELSPAEMDVLAEGGFHRRALVGMILDLVRRGWIAVDVGVHGNGPLLLRRLSRTDAPSFTDAKLLAALFAPGETVDVRKENEALFRFMILHAPTLVFHDLHRKGLYSERPVATALTWLLAGAMWIGISLLSSAGAAEIGGVISGAIVMVFGVIMPKTTAKGARVREQVLGYKRYLAVAEADRLAFHFGPATRPEQLPRHLPYAVALGVDRVWMRQFGSTFPVARIRKKGENSMETFDLFFESERILTEAKEAAARKN